MKTEKALLVTTFIALIAAPLPLVLAQGCSGGPDGGADATGNQCSVSTPSQTEIEPALWTRISAHMAPSARRAVTVDSMRPSSSANDVRPVAAPSQPGAGAGDIDSSRWAAR